LVLVCLLFLAFGFRGFLHPLFWVMRGWIMLVLFAFAGVLFFATRGWMNKSRSLAGCCFRVCIILALALSPSIIYLAVLEPLTGVAVLGEINSTTMDSLPPMLDTRYTALDVAKSVGESMMADSRYNAGDIDPFDSGGKLSYSVPRVPNGLYNSYYGHPNGIMLVEPNLTTTKPDIRIIEQQFEYGEGMGWLCKNSIYYQVYIRHWWCEIPEIYYLPIGGELVGIAPYLEYKFQSWVFVPHWAGVFVFHGDGRIERLSKEQALNDTRFAGQRLYPESMARIIADSWQYQRGIRNAFLEHVDMAMIDDPISSDNQMPYLMPITNGGVKSDAWVNVFKPSGSNTDAVYKVQYIDARNGDVKTYSVIGQGWIGPNKAIEIVKNLHKMWDWNTFDPVEALPVFSKTHKFFWQVSLINTKSKMSMVETVLVDGKTLELYEFANYQSLKRFLDTGVYIPIGAEEQKASLDITQMSLSQLGETLQKVQARIMDLAAATG
jgi:hypothetical protein